MLYCTNVPRYLLSVVLHKCPQVSVKCCIAQMSPGICLSVVLHKCPQVSVKCCIAQCPQVSVKCCVAQMSLGMLIVVLHKCPQGCKQRIAVLIVCIHSPPTFFRSPQIFRNLHPPPPPHLGPNFRRHKFDM